MKRERLDDYLIRHGYASDKDEAFIVVTEGRVLINDQKAVSPAQSVDLDSRIEIREPRQFVGRGARKLEAALDAFGIIHIEDWVCADIGTATGGFTEVLLLRGAARVYAIDTARGKLALKLRQNPRVIVMEETDVRDLDHLSELIDLVTIDVSLVRLRSILPTAAKFLAPRGFAVVLFKPQYETRDAALLRRGVIRNTDDAKHLLEEFIKWAEENGWKVEKWIESPIKGNKGNTEYLLHLKQLDFK